MHYSEITQGNNERGFVYVWVLLSVALIGLGLAIAVQVDAIATRRDKEKELLAIGRQFREGLRRYQESAGLFDGVKKYPEHISELIEDTRSGTTKRHLRKIFIDPISGKAEWGAVFKDGRIIGIHSLSQEIPIKQDGFAVEDVGFRGAKSYSQWIFAYPADVAFGF